MIDRYAAYIEAGAEEIRKMAEDLERAHGVEEKDRLRRMRELEAELTLPDDIYEDVGLLDELAGIREDVVAKARAIYEEVMAA